MVANPGEEHLTKGNDDLSQEVESRRSSSSEPRRPKILTFHEKRLQGLMGPDAVQYLRFQKYIIIFILFTTTVSLGVILPLNFQVRSFKRNLPCKLSLSLSSGDTVGECN